jgi:hypothetical protein
VGFPEASLSDNYLLGTRIMLAHEGVGSGVTTQTVTPLLLAIDRGAVYSPPAVMLPVCGLRLHADAVDEDTNCIVCVAESITTSGDILGDTTSIFLAAEIRDSLIPATVPSLVWVQFGETSW